MTRTEEMTGAYRVLVGRSQGKRYLKDLGIIIIK